MIDKNKIAKERAEENKKTREFFVGFMKGKGYEYDGKHITKGFVQLTFMNSGRRVRGTDTNPDHKFPHIVLCLTPNNKELGEALYYLLEFNVKEIGVKADRKKKKEGYCRKGDGE